MTSLRERRLGPGARPDAGGHPAASRRSDGRAADGAEIRGPRGLSRPWLSSQPGRSRTLRFLLQFAGTFASTEANSAASQLVSLCQPHLRAEAHVRPLRERLRRRGFVLMEPEGTDWLRRSPRTLRRKQRRRRPTPPTAPRTSPSSRAWRRSASAPACTSARPAPAACTTSSTRSSTTRSTRRSPATATRVQVVLHPDNSCTVTDDGRGIPVDDA